jgi:TRAP-type uncharacterized transport system fused permease subunit
MLWTLLRVALLCIIAVLLINPVVIGLATSNTGPLEKVVLAGLGVLLLLAAVRVHRIGAHTTTRA